MKELVQTILMIAVLLLPNVVQAQDVVLEGVLGNKAVVSINGARHIMRRGQSISGVRLDSVNRDHVFLTIAGEHQRLAMGSRVTGGYSARQLRTRVYSNSRGMFLAAGQINGSPINMLLDTGATFVALNTQMADSLGIDYRNGVRQVVNTAAGAVNAYRTELDSVSVGDISLNGVDAFVVQGHGPDVPLLGMSFLNQLKVSSEGGVMVLEQYR